MSLQGSIEMFPVNEVLRMLVRSSRAAALLVDTEDGRGAIHVAGGSVLSAEFIPVVALVDALRIRGFVTADDAESLDGGGRTVLEMVDEQREAEVRQLIAERSVEALHRIALAGGGTFRVEVDGSPEVRTGFTYDLDELIDLASLRAEEWSSVLDMIGDAAVRFELCGPPPGTDEIALSDASWRIACVLGGSPTIRTVAATLGTTEYEIARELVQLVRAGLATPAGSETAEPGDRPIDSAAVPSQDGWWQEPEPTSRPAGVDQDPAPSQDGWWEDPEPAVDEEDPDADEPSESSGEEQGPGIGRRSMGVFARRVLEA